MTSPMAGVGAGCTYVNVILILDREELGNLWCSPRFRDCRCQVHATRRNLESEAVTDSLYDSTADEYSHAVLDSPYRA